jgi:hypothetical protein
MSNDFGIFGDSRALGGLATGSVVFPKILKPTTVTFPKILKSDDPAPAAVDISNLLGKQPTLPKPPLDLSALLNRRKQTIDLTGGMMNLATPADAAAPADESAAAGPNSNLLMYAAIGGVVLVGAYLLLGRK